MQKSNEALTSKLKLLLVATVWLILVTQPLLHLTWLINSDFDCSKPEKVTNGNGHTPDPPSR